MKYVYLLYLTLVSSLAWGEEPNINPERDSVIGGQEAPVLHLTNHNQREFAYTQRELEEHPKFTAQLLNLAITKNNGEFIAKILRFYEGAEKADAVLIDYAKAKLAKLQGNYAGAIKHLKQILAKNPELDAIRFELATALFYDRQDINAKNQFHKLQSSKNTSRQLNNLINKYLEALEKRNEWNVDISFNYVRETNINNVSNSRYIGSWKKPDSHLPQTANGFEYYLGVSKDFNLQGKHYLAFENHLNGENYWDNHQYDDITNRTYLGYRYKSANTTFSLLPFYKRNWSGDSHYNNWSNGIKANIYQRLTPHFNFSLTGEYSKNHYPRDDDFNGHYKMLSGTLLWRKNPEQSFYIGLGVNSKTTNVKRFDSVKRSIHVGWNQEWSKGISSRLGIGYSQTKYGGMAKYGGVIPLGKIREDDAYSANLFIWKRDWELFGIIPKLHLNWKKQISNIPSIYSYDKKNVNIIFEKSF